MRATTLKVTGINHVVLHVTSVERSKRFYIEILGFEDRNVPIGPSMKACFLRCGVQGLDLFEVSGHDVFGGKEMNHMALSIEADELDELITELSNVDVEVSDKTPRGTVFISDPDGHRIELLPRSASERSLERGPERQTK